jgi:NAD/NADP transhydrogenase beta subunit
MAKVHPKTSKQKSSESNVPREIERFADLLDTRFRVGNFRFGIDPIIGLIPGIGDFLAMILSGRLIALAGKYGASGKVMVLMSLNAFLDATIGSIPFLGGIFDFFYRANTRNVRILENHFKHGKHQGSGKGLVVVILLVVLAITILAIYLIWELITYLLALI